MQITRRMCSIHQVVELVPGVWTLHRVARLSYSSNDRFIEAVCPTCLQVAREVFAQQFPTFSPAATPHARPSTS